MSDSYGYALLNDGQIDDISHHNPALFSQLLALKQFPPPDVPGDWIGPAVTAFRLWPMQHQADLDFGHLIRIVGYDLSPIQPGKLSFTPYFRAVVPIRRNYNLYLHLYPLDQRQIVSQADGAPAGLKRLTISWADPTETIVGSTFKLQAPASGCYRLAVGLYNNDTHERLPIGDQDFALLKTFCLGVQTF